MRKKFTTTLNPEHRQKLRVYAAMEGLKAENDMLEKMIEEWGKKYEMENESRQSRQTK